MIFYAIFKKFMIFRITLNFYDILGYFSDFYDFYDLWETCLQDIGNLEAIIILKWENIFLMIILEYSQINKHCRHNK
jgi:hypothetical protein